MKDKVRTFPNGFLFTKEENIENLPPHYEQRSILKKYNYYYDTSSRKIIHIDNDSFIIIHGLFVHIDPENGDITKKSPKLLLEAFNNNYDQFLDHLDYLGGRFAIIIGNAEETFVYPDATGSRSIYYYQKNKSISSHSKLLKEIFNIPNDPLTSTTYDYRTFFDYSLFKNVVSMVPNFYLDINKGDKIRFFPRENNKYHHTSEIDKFNIIEFLWKEQLKHFVTNDNKMIFSLTGGADSRISLAMAKKYMPDIKAFTYTPYEKDIKPETTKDELLYLDKLIVNQILDNLRLDHKFLYFRDDTLTLNDNENKIIVKNTVRNHGKNLLPYYLEHFSEQDIVHIRANLLEIGRAYYISDRSTNTRVSIQNHARHKLLKGLKSSDIKYNKIEEQIDRSITELNYEAPHFDYHLLDLYYWENRMGRWMSEVLNETDIVFETFLPFNMRAIIEASLSFDLKKRKTDYLFNELINRNHPILNFFGKNKISNIYEEMKLKQENDYFDSFKVFDQNNKLIHVTDSIHNLVYLPKNYVLKNYYAESLPYVYKNDKGAITISILNEYSNIKAKNHLKYSLILNGVVILTEDISLWKLQNYISISGLKKGDKLQIRVSSLKNIDNNSWENASRTLIKSIKETPLKRGTKYKISSSSPYSLIH